MLDIFPASAEDGFGNLLSLTPMPRTEWCCEGCGEELARGETVYAVSDWDGGIVTYVHPEADCSEIRWDIDAEQERG